MVLLLFMTALLATFAYPEANFKRYDGYQVFAVIPRLEEDIEKLHEIQEGIAEISFWKEVSLLAEPVHIMVPPKRVHDFIDLLDGVNLEHTLWIEDVQEIIDSTQPRTRHGEKFGWTKFYRLQQVGTKKFPV